MRNHTPLKTRIEELSIPVTECGCWIWIGATSANRYGALRVNGRTMRSNRASYTAFKGPIPAGMHVLHKCDVTFCVNPDHLFLGTHQDNMDDRERKGRGNQPKGLRNGRHTKPERTCRGKNHHLSVNAHLRRGAGNPRAKLSEADAIYIKNSTERQCILARRYRVTKTTIKGIRTGRIWSHL